MRITPALLRRIIREELERSIDEMAWGGHMGVQSDLINPDDDGWVNSSMGSRIEMTRNAPAVRRYTVGPHWAKLAQQHFSNLPFNVWTAPYVGAGYVEMDDDFRPLFNDGPGEEGDLDNRMKIMPLDVGLPKLKAMGYDISSAKADDFVILFTMSSTDKDFLGTPWMLLHAMFDGGTTAISQLVPDWRSIWPKFDAEMEPYMTMKAARTGFFKKMFATPRDVAAEAMCQELLTRGGFTLQDGKKGKPPPKSLLALMPIIKEAAENFRRNAPGHLVTVVLT